LDIGGDTQGADTKCLQVRDCLGVLGRLARRYNDVSAGLR
jgi:hypothetical protein